MIYLVLQLGFHPDAVVQITFKHKQYTDQQDGTKYTKHTQQIKQE